MANFYQHSSAFLDPNIAINEDGYLVHADGLFDSGSGSNNYVSVDELTDAQVNRYNDDSFAGIDWSSGFATSSDDVLDNEQNIVDKLNEAVLGAATQQQAAAQSSADRAMEFSAEQAQLNRDFQKEMSDTAYQRAMADMKAAGLNPKLVAQLGGASTPSGYTASGTAASMSAASLGPVAQVLSTYITGADALDRNQNDFVKSMLSSLISVLPYLK